MATFEENTMETIEKIVRNLDTMTKSIVDLYGKIEELNKSTMKIIELTSKEKREPQTGLNGIMEQIENLEVPKTDDCDFCCGTGVVLVDDYTGQYIDKCPVCHGTGKTKRLESESDVMLSEMKPED